MMPQSLLNRPLKIRFYIILCIAISLLLICTFLNSIGLRKLPLSLLLIIYYASPYDQSGPAFPISFVIAYLAGLDFLRLKRHLTIRLPNATLLLVASTLVGFLSMGIAQHLSPPLWNYIKPEQLESKIFLNEGGFNLHTIFYVIWSTFVFFTIPVSVISIFAQAPWTRRKWGFWARHTYLQTYINMIPILIAIYYLKGANSLLMKYICVSILGLVGSWAFVLVPVACWWLLKSIFFLLLDSNQ